MSDHAHTLTVEEWRAIPGLPGYEASNQGAIRSLRRSEPRLRRVGVGPCGFRTVQITTQGVRTSHRVGTLVALAWLGPRPDGAEIRRLDGDPLNDLACNLAYGSASEVAADHAARARREEAAGAPTHCPSGHRYGDDWLGMWGERRCPTCLLENKPPKRPESKRRQQRRYRDKHGDDISATRRARRKPKPPKTGTCEDCDAALERSGPGPLAKRCADCKRTAQRAADARWHARRFAPDGPPTPPVSPEKR